MIRLTDSQQRFEVLWQKRLAGELTLKELAEMDDIINRDPAFYQFVLQALEQDEAPPLPPPASTLKKVIAKLRSIFQPPHLFFYYQLA